MSASGGGGGPRGDDAGNRSGSGGGGLQPAKKNAVPPMLECARAARARYAPDHPLLEADWEKGVAWLEVSYGTDGDVASTTAAALRALTDAATGRGADRFRV